MSKADDSGPPERIYLSRGKSKGSWEYNGCWGVFPFQNDVGNVAYVRADLVPSTSPPAVDSQPVPNPLGVSASVAVKLLSLRDAIAQTEGLFADAADVWHILYSIADPTFLSLEPWAVLEAISPSQPVPAESSEYVKGLRDAAKASCANCNNGIPLRSSIHSSADPLWTEHCKASHILGLIPDTASPVAAGEQEDSQPAEDQACPCLHTEPCQPRCTCVNKYSSRGCSFCCSYGSKKQQVVRAEHLRQLILLGIQTESASSPQSVWEQAILIVRTQAGLDIDSCRELIEELEAARDAQENK